MNLREFEERVAAVEPSLGVEYLEALLLACGFTKMTVSRLINGSTDKAETPNERLLKGKVYFHSTTVSDEELYPLIDAAREDPRVIKHAPRFLIVKNERRLLAVDLTTGDPLDIAVQDLGSRAEFFAPWIGIEKVQLEDTNYADVKAAERMAKLYDEVIKHNSIETEADIHDLNVFFSRLLFCFFAEDTGVFEKDKFTNTIGSYTQPDGGDTHELLDRLFEVLDLDYDEREGVADYLKGFGHVNGKLFDRKSQSPAPHFSAKARALILECGTLVWSQINPDIFGSMIQAVVHPSQREGLGMHYTSVENIMKVIRPLFLDDLEEVFGKADTTKQLNRLLDRIADIQIFDPACGSGNFLVISYKELRRLEHRILQRLIELDPRGRSLFADSKLKLENFYGIEIDDFAHEIAILSLWLAKHQMNVEFKELFGTEIPLIPLRDSGSIRHGNAALMDWESVCDPGAGEVFVLGNPPYQGGTRQTSKQKQDLQLAFGEREVNRYLDYVSIWLYKGARFAVARNATVGFVSTNSVCQGNHVGLLWPHIFQLGVEISFAHAPFRWTNAARGNAGVICIVLGLAPRGKSRSKQFLTDGARQVVSSINAYLVPDGTNVIVEPARAPLGDLPAMVFGSMPRDGGHLLLDVTEAEELMRTVPETRAWLRRYGGAREALKGDWRACLWIPDEEADRAASVPEVGRRMARVRASRAQSTAASTRAYADRPHRFVQRAHKETNAIIVPRVSSERREYIPADFVGADTVVSDLANAVYNAELWVFGLIQSRMHMTWVRTVAGRLKSDIRYAASLVYNTFPTPPLSDERRRALAASAGGVLAARELFPDQALGLLYDPVEMPVPLRDAHHALDERVDRLYRDTPFESDSERLALLLERYEALAPTLTREVKDRTHRTPGTA